jgi:predicted lactoylglutathione lyase
MSDPFYINLPVKHLTASKAFFTQLGFTFDPELSDMKSACMIVNDQVRVMLITEAFFKTFTSKELCDSKRSAEVIFCLSRADRAAVDTLVTRAIEAGGGPVNPPRDHGFMYEHGFHDLDGHLWNVVAIAPRAKRWRFNAA